MSVLALCTECCWSLMEWKALIGLRNPCGTTTLTPISVTHIFSSQYTLNECQKTQELYKGCIDSVESFEISERVGVISYSQRVKSSRTKRQSIVRNATKCP